MRVCDIRGADVRRDRAAGEEPRGAAKGYPRQGEPAEGGHDAPRYAHPPARRRALPRPRAVQVCSRVDCCFLILILYS